MRRLVKICGLSTERSLDTALAAGADMVGFVFFEKSPRHVSLARARQLGARGRGRAKIVALSVDADDEALGAIIDAIAPDFLQLHGRETPDRLIEIKARFGIAAIKAIGVSGPADLAPAKSYGPADMLLFDAKAPKNAAHPGGNGIAFDWRLLAGLDAPQPYLLSGGLDPENVGEAIALTGASGVDVSSGVESAPGVKDDAKIAAFIARARQAFAAEDDKGETRTFAGRIA
jgi:phosphoribosylanthranilate isomerase